MGNGNVISDQDARRIGVMLRWFESTGHGALLPHRRGPRWWPAKPNWGKITTAWSSTTPNQVTVNPCKQDGTSPDTDVDRTVYLTTPTDNEPDGADLAVDDVIAYVQFHDIENDDTRGIMIGLANEGTIASVDTLLPAGFETEPAQADTWDRTSQGATDGMAVRLCTRIAYDDTSDEKLYAYYRLFTFDSIGQVVTVSAETRVEVDAPVDC